MNIIRAKEPFALMIFIYTESVINLNILVTDAKCAMSVKEFGRSDSERGSLSSLEIDVRPTEYSTRDSVTSLHYRSLQTQNALPVAITDSPTRSKQLLQCSDVPSRKRYHTAPREKHRVSIQSKA